tara:strand:- start:525 stop:728 length:204 start_codon:yes stop_codon:yes gene_type:complete
MPKTAPIAIKTNENKVREFQSLTKVKPSPKCFEGSMSKGLGHLLVFAKTGQMTSTEISKIKKKIIEE